MWYRYLLFLFPLLILVVAAQSTPSIYYTGYWTADPGIRLYKICCIGSIELPGNYIRVYAPESGDILSYISPTGLNFSMDSGIRIKGGVNFTPEDPKVIFTHGLYRIYFTVPNTSSNGNPVQRVYTATSTESFGFMFSNITPISDPYNSSFNNATAFVSNPSVSEFPNGTIGIYYTYTSKTEPIPPCRSLFMFATSSDGINFTNKGCVSFTPGRSSYNFIDPTWSVLPNGGVMLISATQSPLYTPPDIALGLYVSYSTDRSWLNFTTPKLIISPPGPNKTTEIDLLQDPQVNYLTNGSYRMYYNVYPTLENSNYKTNSSPIYIDSAIWVPTPNVSYNSTSIADTTTSTVLSTSTTTIPKNNSTSSTTTIQNQEATKADLSILAIAIVVIAALAILFYLLGRRMS